LNKIGRLRAIRPVEQPAVTARVATLGGATAGEMRPADSAIRWNVFTRREQQRDRG